MRDEDKSKEQLIAELADLRNSLAEIKRGEDRHWQAEEALRESEELLRHSQEIAHLGSWELDLDSNVLTWSDEAYRIFGFQPGEVNVTYEIFLSAVHPDDRAAVNAAYTGSIREGADAYEIEHRVVRKSSGEVLYVQEKCKHIRDSTGRIIRSIGMTLDITERRMMEEQLRESRQMLQAVLDTIPVRVFWKDLNSVYLGCNRSFALDAGLSDPEELLGKDDYAMGWREYADLYRADDRLVMESGRPKLNFEEPQATPDGKQVVLRTSKIPLRDATGRIRGVLGTYEDLTELKKAADEKERLEVKLLQAQKLETIGTLAGGIAHDFNNLLQPIYSCAELIRSRIPVNSPLEKYVDLMSRTVERGRDLVRQLLTFSRQRPHERRPLRLQPVVSETLSLLRAVVPATVEIHGEIEPVCGPVMADPIQIQQVVMNLCTNACDAMNRNGTLTVRLSEVVVDDAEAKKNPQLRPGRYARLVVRDTGHGMDDETMKRMFDPFFTTKEVGKGTGLGLSVVHGIVLEHGGEIVVESDPGSGTTFYVYLPCSGDVVEEESECGEVVPERGKETILFVDDEEDIVFIAREMLEDLGYNVTAMSHNANALEEFRQNPGGYDLVISDYSMPGMSGVQLAEELLKIRPDIPVLLISGNDEAIPSEKLKEATVRGVISKPFRMSEIGETVRRVLDQG